MRSDGKNCVRKQHTRTKPVVVELKVQNNLCRRANQITERERDVDLGTEKKTDKGSRLSVKMRVPT